MSETALIGALKSFWQVYTTVPNATRSALHIKPIEVFSFAQLQLLGVPDEEISNRHSVRLGCLWPKNCDVVVGLQGPPKLVISCKSISTSFGNNANNRLEEALADAVNLRDCNKQLVMGLVFVMADNDESRGRTGQRGGKNYVEFFEAVFRKLQDRDWKKGEEYKYERIAFLPVDFRVSPPRPDSRCFDDHWPLNTSSFFKDLWRTTRLRWGLA